jgi:ribosome-associated protein YbcJ (S4-like RNA binding protein)
VINHREERYFIAASSSDAKVKVNEEVITGQYELSDGDLIEVAGVRLNFTLSD